MKPYLTKLRNTTTVKKKHRRRRNVKRGERKQHDYNYLE